MPLCAGAAVRRSLLIVLLLAGPSACGNGSPVGSDSALPAVSVTQPTSTFVTSTTLAPPTTVTTTTVIATTTTAAVPATTTVATDAPVDPAGPPSIDAAAYAVYDVGSQRWIAEHEADSARPVGSLMKLLTAFVVMQAGDPTHVATVPAMQLDTSESSIGLYEGERLSREVLLRAMLIVSANDAARTLAVDVAGGEQAFVEQMNAAAQALGMANTVAANPTGLGRAGRAIVRPRHGRVGNCPDGRSHLPRHGGAHRRSTARIRVPLDEPVAVDLRRCDRSEDGPHHRRADIASSLRPLVMAGR